MPLQIEGTAWLFGDDINTDLILPGAAFLLPVEEQIKYCFSLTGLAGAIWSNPAT